jgi:hypothetical protein
MLPNFYTTHPSGMAAGSRWLSAQRDTTAIRLNMELTPEGLQQRLVSQNPQRSLRDRIPYQCKIGGVRSFLARPPANCCETFGFEPTQKSS